MQIRCSTAQALSNVVELNQSWQTKMAPLCAGVRGYFQTRITSAPTSLC
jgi:hypothetical protein